MARTPFRITDMRVIGTLAPQTGDVAAPSVPQNVAATAINAGRVDVSWTASTDDFGVSGYQIFRNGSPLNTTSGTTYSDTTCQPSTAYSYVIVAFDAAGHSSAPSNPGNATTPANASPVWQSIPAQTPIVGNSFLLQLTDYCTDADLDTITFSIPAGTPPTGITLSGTRLQGTPTVAGQTPTITVRAADAFHQIDTTIAFSTKTADVTAPPVPTGLAANPVSSSQINVSWNASTDAAGTPNEQVTGTKDYRVYRDGSLRTTQTGTSYSDTGLASNTSYAYRVSVRDNALNESAQSSQVTATTQASGGSVLTHGQPATITGSGFQSQTAPIVYDDATGDMNTIWTEAYPFNAAARSGSDVAYRTSPFTRPWGSGAQAVSAPGRYSKLAAGGNDNPQASYYTYRNGFAKVFTKPSGNFIMLTRWWERLDSLYADGQRNFKVWDFALNEPYQLPNNWYIDLQPGSTPTSTSNPTYEINDDSSVGIRGTPGASGVVGNWHSGQAGHYYGAAGYNRRDNWICHEVWSSHAPLGTGRVALYENQLAAALPVNRMDTGFTVNTQDGWGGNQRAVIVGAYNDPSQNCWRYIAGVYFACATNLWVPYITNSALWSTSTLREVQNHSSITSSSIPFPKVEGCRLAAGPVYVHLRTAPWISQSDSAVAGPYTLSG